VAAENVLAQAVDGVADGAMVNWRVLQGLARSDEERSELKWLQVLGAIAGVHQSSQADDAMQASGTTMAVPAAAAIGAPEEWGRYRLVRKLGSGSFGSVYCAWDPELERNIAIKILHEHIADDRLRQRLLREGRALARVQHANVVQVFGVELHGSRAALCMELISGETLAAVLRTHGVLSHREAGVVGEDVCRALAAVHAAGYVHRDVKAQNVMRDKTGKIVLMDFGTGHDSAGSGHGPLDIVGTPVYMAPEVMDGAPASVRSDVYAVGVLLYHLVTGHYPVEGGTLLDLIDAHKSGRRHPLLERRPDLPWSFAQVVARALAPDPADRWPSAGAMLEALGGARPADTRPVAQPWVRAASRIAAGVIVGLVGLVFLGTVSSRYFNAALGRELYVAEGLRDWLYFGVVSSVAPVVLVLMVLVGLSVLRVGLGVLLWLWPGARRQARALEDAARRRGLDGLETVSACALVASFAVLAAACWFALPDLNLLFSVVPVTTAPLEALAYLSPLSPENISRHENYRLAFEWTAIILVALWWLPFKLAARRGQRVAAGLQAGAAGLLLLTFLLLDFPYRLLYQAEFEAVEWRGEQCFELGERDTDYLLFCPGLDPPRNRAVRKDANDLVRLGTRLNPFGHPSISPTE
jgi:hypothetical protein